MKRDDDLIRRLMLDLEQTSAAMSNQHKVDGHTADEVAYHLGLIVRQGYAEGPRPVYNNVDTTIPSVVIALRLTPEGHDFVASIRDEGVWSKVKEKTASVSGGVAMEMLKQLAVAVVKDRLGLA